MTHLEPFSILLAYQEVIHLILTPLAIIILAIVAHYDTKQKPIWLMGAIALILHIVMDIMIGETNFLW